MPWKLDENKHLVMQDGNPVWIHRSGQESPFDAEHALTKIESLSKQSEIDRKAIAEAQAAAKAFEGIDVENARKALETVKNLDAKKLIDAGEVERLKAEIKKSYEDAIAAKDQAAQSEISRRDAEIRKLLVSNQFGTSKFREKMVLTPRAAEAMFGDNFKIEDGHVVAYDSAGNRVMSKAKPGDPAQFDEALQLLVESDPERDQLLKPSGAGGGGNGSPKPGGGGSLPPDVDKMRPEQMMKLGRQQMASSK